MPKVTNSEDETFFNKNLGKKMSKLAMLAKNKNAVDNDKNNENIEKSIKILDDLIIEKKIVTKNSINSSIFNKKKKQIIFDESKITLNPIKKKESNNFHNDKDDDYKLKFNDQIFDFIRDSKKFFFFFSINFNDSFQIADKNKRSINFYDLFQTLTINEFNLETINQSFDNFNKPSKTKDKKIINNSDLTKKIKNLNLSNENQYNKNFNLSNEIKNSTNLKKKKSFVLIGHVDSGKSTMMGRILFDCKAVDLALLNQLRKDSKKKDKKTFDLSWIMDNTDQERSRGLTINLSYTDFEKDDIIYSAIDAPGHKDFIPSVIEAVSQSKLALIVIDSISGNFESGFSHKGQTKEHIILAKNLGIEKFCVLINKLDKQNWSKERFDYIKDEIKAFFLSEELNCTIDNVEFIPISGLLGVNVIKRGELIKELDWYSGPTLIDFLKNVDVVSNDDIDPLALSKEFFYLSINSKEVTKTHLVIDGVVISGYIKSKNNVKFVNCDIVLKIDYLKIFNSIVNYSLKNDKVKIFFKIKDISSEKLNMIHESDIISGLKSDIKSVKKFNASIKMFEIQSPLFVGAPLLLFRKSNQIPIVISKIHKAENTKKKNLLHLISKQKAEIEIESKESIAITKFDDNNDLGSFILRRNNEIVAISKVLSF